MLDFLIATNLSNEVVNTSLALTEIKCQGKNISSEKNGYKIACC